MSIAMRLLAADSILAHTGIARCNRPDCVYVDVRQTPWLKNGELEEVRVIELTKHKPGQCMCQLLLTCLHEGCGYAHSPCMSLQTHQSRETQSQSTTISDTSTSHRTAEDTFRVDTHPGNIKHADVSLTSLTIEHGQDPLHQAERTHMGVWFMQVICEHRVISVRLLTCFALMRIWGSVTSTTSGVPASTSSGCSS